MRTTDFLRLPLHGPRLVLRALDDLNPIAEKEVASVTAIASQVVARADALDLIAHELVTSAREILSAATALQQTGVVLDSHSTQTIERGQDLIALSRSLDETLTVFRQHRPRAIRALDTVEESSRTLRKRWRTPWNPSREHALSTTAAARNDLGASRCMATKRSRALCWKTKSEQCGAESRL